MSAYDPQIGAAYREQLEGICARVARVIEDGQAAGAIRPQLPVAATASALTWMVERTCIQNLTAERTETDAELATAMAEIIWGALYFGS